MNRNRNLALAALAGAALTLPLGALAQGQGAPGTNGQSPVFTQPATTQTNPQGKTPQGRPFTEVNPNSGCIPGAGMPCGFGPKTPQ